jgi:glyoxylase-like metal-dependent hydrolase (beta-lactamase superfamily II)
MVSAPAAQVPAVYRRKIGDIVVTTISDGYVDVPYEMLREITPGETEEILCAEFRNTPPRCAVNCFVVHSAGRVALIDTGFGTSAGPTGGQLRKNLDAAGIDIASIDTVILTHMHPDHSMALTSAEGVANFPKAELVVSERDVKHWHDDAAKAKATERQQLRFFDWGRQQVKPYMDRRRDAVGEVFPGVTAVPLYGHTPGHTGYMISSGGQSLFIWGDIFHFPDVQSQRPDVFVDPDSDPAAAIATRKRTLDMVATDRLLVAGSHMHFPGLLNIAGNAQKGYRLVPEIWVQSW